jgi:hypothetical protein
MRVMINMTSNIMLYFCVGFIVVHGIVARLVFSMELNLVARLLIRHLFVVHGLVMSLWVLILMELGTINGFVDSMLMVVNGLNVVLGIELMV